MSYGYSNDVEADTDGNSQDSTNQLACSSRIEKCRLMKVFIPMPLTDLLSDICTELDREQKRILMKNITMFRLLLQHWHV
jgi:hypothetical protein